MIQVTIPNTNLKISKMIFGTASLIKNRTTNEQLFILNKAVDCGFTHFDTAPLYGFGTSENIVGSVIKKNSNLSVTTKVGLYPLLGINPNFIKLFSIRAIQTLSRRLFGNFKNPLDLTKPIIDSSVQRARKSLENSLENLKRDHIDIYMIHEACDVLFFSEEWKMFLSNIKKEGKIKFTGLALSSNNKNFFINKKNFQLFDILQAKDSLLYKEANILLQNNLPLQITYGYFSSINKNINNFNYSNYLKKILARNKNGAIIVSSNKTSHIFELSQAAI
jgi:aryl-alcohol dehydrogenase-like predicted oxidoreductase